MTTETLPSDYPLLAIIGPSGTGKSTIIWSLIADKTLSITPTWTDRPARPGEESLEHHFVTPEEFDAKLKAGFFAHPPVSFFNLPYRYATPKILTPPPGQIPAIMARVMAIKLLDSLYPNRIIYQIEAPYIDVEQRLMDRAANGIELGSRLEDFNKEAEQGRKYATRVFMNDGPLDKIVDEIKAALKNDYA